MPRSLTSKQQKFVEEICKGAGPSPAYISAYNPKNSTKKTISINAAKLLKDTRISLEIEKNKEKLQEKLTYTLEESFKKIVDIQNKSLEYKCETTTKDGAVVVLNNPDLKTALKAEELKGKLLGLYTEKKEVEITAPIQITFSDKCKGL